MGSEVKKAVEQVDKMASLGSVREPRWMSGEREVGREMEGCWRSERDRRGRVTKPESTPEENRDHHIITFLYLSINPFYKPPLFLMHYCQYKHEQKLL